MPLLLGAGCVRWPGEADGQHCMAVQGDRVGRAPHPAAAFFAFLLPTPRQPRLFLAILERLAMAAVTKQSAPISAPIRALARWVCGVLGACAGSLSNSKGSWMQTGQRLQLIKLSSNENEAHQACDPPLPPCNAAGIAAQQVGRRLCYPASRPEIHGYQISML